MPSPITLSKELKNTQTKEELENLKKSFLEKNKPLNKKVQGVWALLMSLSCGWTAYSLWNQNYIGATFGLGVCGFQAFEYIKYFNAPKPKQQKNPMPEHSLSGREILQLFKEDPMYALCTLVSLGMMSYGIAHGVVHGDFKQIFAGIGLLGICNLIKGHLSDNSQTSRTCLKIGSIAAITALLFTCRI